MRVLLITPMFPTKKNPAHGSFIAGQIDSVQKLGSGVSFKIVANRVSRTGFPHNIVKFALLAVKTIVAAIREDFDIVHAHGLTPTGNIATIASVLRKKPLVITLHGNDVEIAWRSAFWKRAALRSANRANRLIAVSKYIKTRMVDLIGVDDGKIDILHLGVDLATFSTGDKGLLRRKFGIGMRTKALLFVGNLIPSKGAHKIIETLPTLLKKESDLICIFIGEGPQRSELERLSSGFGASHLTRFEKFKDQNELSQWMAASDIIVLPSDREAFGLVALEAMACGVPPIVSSVGGARDYVTEEVNGFLVDPNDREELAERIGMMLFDEELCRSMGTQAIETAKSFDRTHKSKELYELYQEVIKTVV